MQYRCKRSLLRGPIHTLHMVVAIESIALTPFGILSVGLTCGTRSGRLHNGSVPGRWTLRDEQASPADTHMRPQIRRTMSRKHGVRWLTGALFAAMVLSPAVVSSQASAATTCTPIHCYSTIKGFFSGSVTSAWTTLTTKCMSLDDSLGDGTFNNNEIWTGTPAPNYYVEFGHTYHIMPGLPTAHWFWARTLNGTMQGFDLNKSYTNGTAYNATINWTGSSGSWLFYQGGTLYGSGGGNYPNGPIKDAQVGGEMNSKLQGVQVLSFSDSNSGRVEDGVRYTNLNGATLNQHAVPPFSSSPSWGDGYISDHAPANGSGNVC